MRVYLKDKQIPVKDVTWDILCNFATYVDYTEDIHVEWPARIRFERRMVINKVNQFFGIDKAPVSMMIKRRIYRRSPFLWLCENKYKFAVKIEWIAPKLAQWIKSL